MSDTNAQSVAFVRNSEIPASPPPAGRNWTCKVDARKPVLWLG